MHHRPEKWWTDQEHERNKGQKNNMSRAHSVTSEMAVILEGSLGLHNREIHNLLFFQQMFQLLWYWIINHRQLIKIVMELIIVVSAIQFAKKIS